MEFTGRNPKINVYNYKKQINTPPPLIGFQVKEERG
jgi:hypothetical protein